MSVMPNVAELLGVKMNEHFYVAITDNKTESPNEFKPVKLTDMGLVEVDSLNFDSRLLNGLICGILSPRHKTFLDDFKEKFPKNTLNPGSCCVLTFYGDVVSEEECDNIDCENCWLKPYSE